MKVLKYLTVGLFQFLLDLGLFLLLQTIGLPLFLANATSRLTAATTGYYLNRHFTFSVAPASDYSMVTRYWLFWTFMTLLSTGLMMVWQHFMSAHFHLGIGKFIVESFLCIVGFLISKFWVYKHD
jgi:putative flippase GtrA